MMEDKYDVTVIVPVYNVEKYIRRCLQSVIEQQADGLSIECLLIDDCSPDDSIAIARHFVEDYRGSICFRFLRHEQNRGLSAARNTGIDAARGDFLMFLDSDDNLAPGAVAEMLQASALHPQSALVMGQYAEGQHVLPDYGSTGCLNDGVLIQRMFLEEKISFHAWNKLVSRKLVKDHSLYFAEGILFEDVLWSSRLFTVVDSVVLIPVVTYHYQDNPASIMRTVPKRANHAVSSYLYSADKVLELSFTGLYAVQRLFVFRVLVVNALYLYVCLELPAETRQRFLDFRRRLMADALRHRHFPMAAFFLLMYSPFCHLLRLAVFRHHFDQIYRLAKSIIDN